MRIRFFSILAAMVLCGLLTQAAAAGEVLVTGLWARPTPPGAQVGAVYFSMENRGPKADELLSVATDLAGSVEIHDSQTVKGMMQMRPVASVKLPAGATVKVEPGGLHVMLLGLKRPLIKGARFDLTLRFRDAGTLRVQVPVQNGA